ncbi:MAG: AMP-binding protein [Candidatus Anaerobiospirillum pullicola]|uniref:AMP-binding protein n=1 Tax=Candidatus Anaerobiospirillum pullicola TaxID=2838451 RepID=A0A948THG2_9GAMM|nr:AMP-binding protein [Candidatus Anaerobiospirillum pullicola]
MGRTLKVISTLVTTLVTALWPLIIFVSYTADLLGYVLPLIALIMGVRVVLIWRTNRRLHSRGHQRQRPLSLVRAGLAIAALAVVLSLLSLGFSTIGFMLYYPVAVNLTLLVVFAASLTSEHSLVERLARLQDPHLSARAVLYTRKVTQAWCLFFICNGTIATLTALRGDIQIWTWWNGLLSYGAMGLMFGVEYLLRRRLQTKERSQEAQNQQIALATWFKEQRIIAYNQERTFTTPDAVSSIAYLRQLLAAQQAKRVALVIECPYLFALAFIAVLSLKCRPVILGHHNESLLLQQQELFDLVLTDLPALTTSQLKCCAITSCEHASQAAALQAVPVMPEAPAEQVVHAMPVMPEEPEALEQQAEQVVQDLKNIAPEDTFELYTSGSTGTPKCVLKTVGEMEAEAQVLAEFFGNKLHGATLISTVFPYHMYGLTFSVFLPWSTQTPLYLPQIHYSEELAALPPHDYVLLSSPAFLKRLDFKLTSPQLNAIILAGGPLSSQYRLRLSSWCGVTPTEIYGSTEAGVMAWRQALSDDLPFNLFPDVSMEVTSEQVTVHSAHVAKTLSLDDRVELGPAHTIKLLGRRDRIVKIAEKRLSLTAIEAALMTLPAVKAAAATVVTRNEREFIAAAVVVTDGSQGLITGAQYLFFRQKLAHVLEPHALPRILLKVAAIPENAMGKRDMRALHALFAHTP